MSDTSSQASHWVNWHAPYEDPESPLSRRLAAVQDAIRTWLASAPLGRLSVISCCAGQGRDLIGALGGNPRAADVRARLVEADAGNVEVAHRLVETAELTDVITVVCGDASNTRAFAGAVPADLVLMCGVFGNISDSDIRRTINLLPSLCADGATVIWTRHRRPPDRTGEIRSWFAESGFEETSWFAPEDTVFGVGVHRLCAGPAPFGDDVQMFDFVGDGHRPA